jgi:adenylate cyclase
MTVRRLAAILAADVVGFSKLVGEDEAGTLAALRDIRKRIVNPVLAAHGGRIFKLMGDGMLAEFPSAVEALRAAIDIQDGLRKRNEARSSGQPIEVRIGVHQGDVVVEGTDLLGDGVNIAARLEALATPGGICISARVHEDATGKIALQAQDMGEQSLKNIARPVRAYQVALGASRASSTKGGESRPALPLPDKPSIAVLPFQNMSGDPEQEYFADGMVEEIITALSRFRQLFVIARNSSFTYKGKAADVKQVGRELGVRYVLEGSVRKASARVRITGQLIDASTGAHLWADRFDGGLEDIFELQDRVTASVVDAIAPKLEQVEIERAQRKPTDSLDAYDCFLRGIATLHQYVERQQVALRLFYRATELDPNFASAYAMAAFCYTIRKQFGWRTDPARESAEAVRLARRAMDLTKDDAQALALSGLVLAHSGRDLDSGVALIDRAVTQNPNLATAWYLGVGQRYGSASRRRPSKASSAPCVSALWTHSGRSPLDPEKHWTLLGLAFAYTALGLYEEGLETGLAALRENRQMALCYIPVIRCFVRLDRVAEARGIAANLLQIDPTFSLRVYQGTMVAQDYERREQYIADLRLAGLPE